MLMISRILILMKLFYLQNISERSLYFEEGQ